MMIQPLHPPFLRQALRALAAACLFCAQAAPAQAPAAGRVRPAAAVASLDLNQDGTIDAA